MEEKHDQFNDSEQKILESINKNNEILEKFFINNTDDKQIKKSEEYEDD